MVCAIWQPVTKAKDADFGRPNISLAHSPHTCSTTASAGAVTFEAAFWSQVEVSQSAASATGSVPPITQPKKRPLPEPISPPSASRTSSSMTASSARPVSGSGLPSRCLQLADGRRRGDRPRRQGLEKGGGMRRRAIEDWSWRGFAPDGARCYGHTE